MSEQKIYKLSRQDVYLINSLMKYFGGYINISSRTFNGEVGPTGQMRLLYRESNFVAAEPMTLNPTRCFGLREALEARH